MWVDTPSSQGTNMRRSNQEDGRVWPFPQASVIKYGINGAIVKKSLKLNTPLGHLTLHYSPSTDNTRLRWKYIHTPSPLNSLFIPFWNLASKDWIVLKAIFFKTEDEILTAMGSVCSVLKAFWTRAESFNSAIMLLNHPTSPHSATMILSDSQINHQMDELEHYQPLNICGAGLVYC